MSWCLQTIIHKSNTACSLQLTTCHCKIINVLLMVHENSNLICILSYSEDYFSPASRLCGVVFIYHLNIPQRVPCTGENPGDTVC